MDQNTLKTSLGQRIVILAAAVIFVGGTILTYVMVVLNNGGNGSSDLEEEVNRVYAERSAVQQKMSLRGEVLSPQYFQDFVGYKSQVKSYNSASANALGLETKDLKAGTGRELTEGDADYMAYYIGWCANGSIFDSSLNSTDDPTSLKAPLMGSSDMIEGWKQGIIGMKLGGVRQLTISGSLAYGDSNQACDGQPNTPLKFVVWLLEPDSEMAQLNQELQLLSLQLNYLLYGGKLYD